MEYGSCRVFYHLFKYETAEINNVLECCGGSRLHLLLGERLVGDTILLLLELLNKGADVNIKDENGQTALHFAVKNSFISPSILKIIIEKSADINSKDKRGKAALHLAISCENYEAVKTLLQVGANPDIEDCKGNSPLHYASYYCLDLVKLLVKHGANVELKNINNETPIHLALGIPKKDDCIRKLIKTIELLLGKGDNINIQSCDGETPLHFAVNNYHKGMYEVWLFLLKNGAKVHLQDKYGNTPLHLLAMYNVNYFNGALTTESGKTASNIANNLKMYPLHVATHNNNIKLIKLLLDNDALVNSVNAKNATALHIAATACNISSQIVILLLEGGASPNVQDVNGKTPLHNAVKYNRVEITQLLLENGGVADMKNKNGETPLHILTFLEFGKDNSRVVICRTLLANGASPNVKDNNEMTPLHYAVKNNSVELMTLLAEHGADLNSKNENGQTPLHILTLQNNSPLMFQIRVTDDYSRNVLCTTFLANGASPNVKDNRGMTPLHYAVVKKRINIVHILLHNGADVNSKNEGGENPLHILTQHNRGFGDTLKLMLQKGVRVNEQDSRGRTALHNISIKENRERRIMIGSVVPYNNVLMLLEWGASQNIKDNFGKTPSDYYMFADAQKEYNIKRTCLYSAYDITKYEENSVLEKLKNDCCHEIEGLKLELFGMHSLYDIFRHCADPIYLSNKELESAIQCEDLEEKFPLYCSLLTSTYRGSRERLRLLDAASAILQIPLPIEVVRYSLTFVDSDSLRNVIKAKEEICNEGGLESKVKS